MVYLSITELMKKLSLTMENIAQNNLLEKRPLDLGLNFGASPHLKDISFMRTICGVDTDLPDTGLGEGVNVVLSLIENCEVKVS